MANRKNHRSRWTDQQIEELKRLVSRRSSPADIAHALGRTVEAILLRAQVEGFSIKSGSRRNRPVRDANRRDSNEVLVVTTGGTIDKRYFDDQNRFAITDTIITKLLEVARVYHPYTVEQVLKKDSLDIGVDDRGKIVDRVSQAWQSRIVVTHGTDTMTETAKALAGVSGKTIVLVGALSPARFAESDASFNLGMAFATAQLAPHGIYIAMNGTIFPGLNAVKDLPLGRFVASEQPGPTSAQIDSATVPTVS